MTDVPIPKRPHPSKPSSKWTEDEFIAELLHYKPELKLEMIDGKRVIRGIRLKTPQEQREYLRARSAKTPGRA